RYLVSTFPVTNRLYRPSRPAYDFVLNFSKDDLNRLVSSWNRRTDDIKSSVQKAPQKTSSVRPETLDDRRDGTMPTLTARQSSKYLQMVLLQYLCLQKPAHSTFCSLQVLQTKNQILHQNQHS